MKWYITGDAHGSFERFENFDMDREIGIIVLGDFCVNYYLDKRDTRKKNDLLNKWPKATFYIVRGNHEARPETLIDIKEVYDSEIQGNVWQETDFPNIKYLQDGGIYTFNGKKALVIGGAYSVDKEHRIINGWSWFPTEQLSAAEQDEITHKVSGQGFDFVFSHTCPFPWMPTDLFLPMVDQARVDNSMELWLDKLKDKINYKVYCFGHFHSDRIEKPGVEQFFESIELLDKVYDRWVNYEKTGQLEDGLVLGPKFFDKNT